MIKLFLIILLPFILFTESCITTNCPDDVKIGEKYLTNTSLSFFPYVGKQKLFFKDELGEDLIFTSPNGVEEIINKISVYKKCTEIKYDGQSSYEYFEGRSKGVVFFSQEPPYSFNLGLYTTILKPEQELFYDRLLVDVTGVGAIGHGELVTDVRFTEPYQEKEFNITNPLEFVDSIKLNGVNFYDIYQSEIFDGRQVYFNKKFGLVGFIHSNKTYNLSKVVND